jgi:hypothetical protein
MEPASDCGNKRHKTGEVQGQSAKVDKTIFFFFFFQYEVRSR